MSNRPIVIVTGAVIVVYIIALVSVFVFYDGDQVIAATLLSGAFGVALPALLSLRQSAENMYKIRDVADKVDENTQITVKTAATANESKAVAEDTHQRVNSRMDQLIATVEQLGAAQLEIKEAVARAEGIVAGRGQSADEAAKILYDERQQASHDRGA